MLKLKHNKKAFQWDHAVADRGFSRGGGANSPGGEGRQHTNMPNVPQNCMKLKEFGLPGGHASLVPPLRSATGMRTDRAVTRSDSVANKDEQ